MPYFIVPMFAYVAAETAEDAEALVTRVQETVNADRRLDDISVYMDESDTLATVEVEACEPHSVLDFYDGVTITLAQSKRG